MRRSSLGGHAGEDDNAPVSSSPPSILRQPSHLHGHGHNHVHGHSHAPTPTPRAAAASPFLLDDDPYPVAKRGQGALVNLIRNRSAISLHAPVPQHGWGANFSFGFGDEEAGENQSLLSGRQSSVLLDMDSEERRMSAILNGQNVRSMRLIGYSNPRYRWARYWKSEDELAKMRKPTRKYYERTNYLVQQYMYIDRLLDSSLPHNLLNEYNDMPTSHFRGVEIPHTIIESEERAQTQNRSREQWDLQEQSNNGGVDITNTLSRPTSPTLPSNEGLAGSHNNSSTNLAKKVKRTPKDIYRPTETTPLFNIDDDEDYDDSEDEAADTASSLDPSQDIGSDMVDPETGLLRRKKKKPKPEVPWLDDEDEELDSGHRIVTIAIYVNFLANAILLAGKIAVVFTVPSMSVLASLVDAMLDFLSTAIVWTTTWMISHHDQYRYPVGRRRLEPLGVLVFSIIMITSFAQVGLQCIQRLASPDRTVIQLGVPAIAIMVSTIVIKGAVWLWCRLIKNTSVQAMTDDALTDMIFNTGSIVFPIVGFYANIWSLDALGGLLLSLVVIFNWSGTSAQHIKNLSGFSASADQRNVLLYLTMRFAKTIKQIQGLQAYHSGDKLNVEVDIVLDASTPLWDSHDLAESLGYVLESVPIVDRAFVHCDYASWNLPTHMQQQGP